VTARFVVTPGGGIRGSVRVPGDKSISHRALMLGGLARSSMTVTGWLDGADCRATRRAMAALGVEFRTTSEDTLVIRPPTVLREPDQVLDLGNSGTGLRLLMGLLAGRGLRAELDGDASIRRRPMERVAAPLRSMGADIVTRNGCPPVQLRATGGLRPIEYAQPVASAQVKSAVLLAGLGAQGVTRVLQPAVSRDHTERMLAAMGCPVRFGAWGAEVEGPADLEAVSLQVPADLSSAAFFIVAALVAGTGPVDLPEVGVNPTRTGVLTVLEAMGARIELRNPRTFGSEPVADLRVHPGPLTGVEIPPELVPLAIDEFPVLFIAAALASGRTRVTGAAELRVKESDRLAQMAAGLGALGASARLLEDGIEIDGGGFRGGTVDSGGDHRVAMAFAVAGAVADGPVTVLDVANVETSFPGFAATARGVGLRISDRGLTGEGGA
jgi:3-phosphoshikimate 1-carboxyvinyltransferase